LLDLFISTLISFSLFNTAFHKDTVLMNLCRKMKLELFMPPNVSGYRDLYSRPTYGLPITDVYSLSEKYRRYKPQYYQL